MHPKQRFQEVRVLLSQVLQVREPCTPRSGPTPFHLLLLFLFHLLWFLPLFLALYLPWLVVLSVLHLPRLQHPRSTPILASLQRSGPLRRP